ncbi:MAG: energy-coupling factor transporter transmembrane protein EcfT [Anaerolineaceae bacterium]|nr:energy-coupling factor transporter transmembrane protein EcfT [Anaerolineaceae bacterium]MBN2678443.1 energy-coupling factor transporter transmembrane protein EcfT [Anaerolineaceae bacterium]
MLVPLTFRPHHTIIERFDPRARWIFSFLMMTAIVYYWDIRFLLFFFFISFTQYFLAHLTWKETRRGWTFIIILISMMVLINTIITSAGTIGAVTQGGHDVFIWNATVPWVGWNIHFGLTAERLWFGFTQIVRLLAITSMFLVLPFTMDPRLYGSTFSGMGLPARLAYSFDLAFRFIPTLARDFNVTMDAQKARGYEMDKVKGGLFSQVKKVAPLIIPVTMNAILSGEDIADAMDLRCFDTGKRTWIIKLTYRWYDYALMIFSGCVLISTLIINHGLNLGNFWMPDWFLGLFHNIK